MVIKLCLLKILSYEIRLCFLWCYVELDAFKIDDTVTILLFRGILTHSAVHTHNKSLKTEKVT